LGGSSGRLPSSGRVAKCTLTTDECWPKVTKRDIWRGLPPDPRGWQTDRERAYVALTRARERTDIYVSREDLGEQGMDAGAIERLAEAMSESHAQQASITRPALDHLAAPAVELAAPADFSTAAQDRGELGPGVGAHSPQGPDPRRESEAGRIMRESEEQRERDRDRERDLGYGIE
jgi:hypothetical protein